MKFEENMHELQEITEKLETGGLSLEESVALYAKGAALAAACRQDLDAAALTVRGLEPEEQAESEGGSGA